MGTMSALPSASFFWSLAQHASAGYRSQANEQDASSPRFLRLISSLLSETGDILRACPTDAQILSAGMRSVVVRVWFSPGGVDLPGLGPAPSVILKYFRRKDSASNSGGFGYLREKHGLTVLNSLAPGTYPTLYFSQDQARLLIFEDLSLSSPSAGTGTLHSLLASPDSQDRAYGVSLYLHFWASLISSPAQKEACRHFARALGSADPVAQRPGSFPTANMVRQGVESWIIHQQISESAYPHATTRLKRDIEGFLYPPQEGAVLTPGDFSPHNLFCFTAPNAYTQPSLSGIRAVSPVLRGIDAEGTSTHHPALPFADLMLGFPLSPYTASYESLRRDLAGGIYREQLAHTLHSTEIKAKDMAVAQFVLRLLANQFDSTSY